MPGRNGSGDSTTPVWSGPTAKRANEIALVLAALGIEHRVERAGGSWQVVVHGDDVARAALALEGYERERLPPPAPPPRYARSLAGVPVAALLWAAYLVTGPDRPDSWWFQAGAASAERLLHGEPWRAVTALTLHADAAHLLSNVVACAVFVTAVARELGPGLGALLILLAGAGGNVLNALLHGAHHASIGASTAIFGAVGILGGFQFGRKRGQRGAWTAVAGALALLAMLGTGERTDITAHLFGLVAGLPLGFAAAAVRRPPGTSAQAVLGTAAAIAVAACWLAASRAAVGYARTVMVVPLAVLVVAGS
jgi:membrane associated rhomboid family serine protease